MGLLYNDIEICGGSIIYNTSNSVSLNISPYIFKTNVSQPDMNLGYDTGITINSGQVKTGLTSMYIVFSPHCAICQLSFIDITVL